MKAVHWVAHSDALPNRSFTLVVVVVRAISTTYFVPAGKLSLDGGGSFCRRRPKRNEFSSDSLETLPGNCPTGLVAA